VLFVLVFEYYCERQYLISLGRGTLIQSESGLLSPNIPSNHLLVVCVCLSVCLSSALWQNGASNIRLRFGMVGRIGPGMRQVVRFGDRFTGRSNFGANVGRFIVTNAEFAA